MMNEKQTANANPPRPLAELSRDELIRLAEKNGLRDARRMKNSDIILALRHHGVSQTSNPMPGAMPKV